MLAVLAATIFGLLCAYPFLKLYRINQEIKRLGQDLKPPSRLTLNEEGYIPVKLSPSKRNTSFEPRFRINELTQPHLLKHSRFERKARNRRSIRYERGVELRAFA